MSKDKDTKDSGDIQGQGRLFDTRTVERNIKRGLVTKKDYEKYLKSLPDARDKTRPAGDQDKD